MCKSSDPMNSFNEYCPRLEYNEDSSDAEDAHSNCDLTDSSEHVDFDADFASDNMHFSSDSDSETMSDTYSMSDELHDWFVQFNITHVAMSALLKILRKCIPDLPKDSRTLVGQGKGTVDVQAIAGGQYYHSGIENGIIPIIREFHISNSEPIKLHINVDGLPIHKSTNMQFWPILGLVANCVKSGPFVIGLFCGNTKPSETNAYLSAFISEMQTLLSTGIMHNNMKYDISLTAVICDTPARAFVKCVKGHAGYHGCDKCTQEGEYVSSRMTFPAINAPKRTNESFRNQSNEEHHVGLCPLTCLPIDMISCFPLDYMHLICLGVMRKLIYLWMRGPLQTRLGRRSIRDLSGRLVVFRDQVPMEFAREPRSLDEIDRWKATELRQFLLYTGPVCLVNVVEDEVYKNFMLLSVGIYILLSPLYCSIFFRFC